MSCAPQGLCDRSPFTPSLGLPSASDTRLTLLFQPMLSLGPGRPCRHVEALVRWDHPRHGLLLPEAFLGFVERAGAMDVLTNRVLELALGQLGAWRRAGVQVDVSINVPAGLVAVPGFDDRVLAILREARIDAEHLTLELTERGALAATGQVQACLMRLRMQGVGISMDDFGSAYSSLRRLLELPFSELKIDQALIQALEWSTQARTIVDSVIRLGHGLGLTVCAEGVESSGQLAFVEARSCDRVQGFYLAEPLSASGLQAFASRGSMELQ